MMKVPAVPMQIILPHDYTTTEFYFITPVYTYTQ